MQFIHRFIFFIFLCTYIHATQENNFLLYDLQTKKWLIEEGSLCDEQFPPQSSFKLFLALIGFDSGILIDEDHPVWFFQEGYEDFLLKWKNPHTPRLWMCNSCLWFSQVLTQQLGMQRFQKYIDLLNYGNRDLSGDPGKNNGLTRAWLSSSLKISPREQIAFLAQMLRGLLPVLSHAIEMTKKVAYLDEMPNHWKLYGKTGSGAQDEPYLKAGWFIGWLEKDVRILPFVYYLRDTEKSEGFGGHMAKQNALKHLIEFCNSN